MAGQIKHFIEHLVEARSRGDRAQMATARTKLLLKGVDPDKYTEHSPDDPTVLAVLEQVATDWGIDSEASPRIKLRA